MNIMEWYYFFNEILDLKEKKKVDISLGRGYFSENKHLRTHTLYLTKMIKWSIFPLKEHRGEDEDIGCLLYIVTQIYIVTVACLGWGSSLKLLLVLLPTKCVEYCRNGRTRSRNRREGHWWELKDVISASLCWEEGFCEQDGDWELGNTSVWGSQRK